MLSTSYTGYNPQTDQNDQMLDIIYQNPDPNRFGNGPFPLFVWTTGTYESYKDAMATTFITQMTARGFVAASVQYPNKNTMQQACPFYQKRAESVYDYTRSDSALGVLCSLQGVDCRKGIVLSGVSQGGALALLGNNYAPDVKAVYVMSIADYNSGAGLGISLPCLSDASTVLPANRLTIVNGESDDFFNAQANIEDTSGFSCPARSFQCWSPDGSGAGWYIVQDFQTSDGEADHCYMLKNGCRYSTPELNWAPPSSYNWSLKPNLDWLATFGTRRNFSTNGR